MGEWVFLSVSVAAAVVVGIVMLMVRVFVVWSDAIHSS